MQFYLNIAKIQAFIAVKIVAKALKNRRKLTGDITVWTWRLSMKKGRNPIFWSVQFKKLTAEGAEKTLKPYENFSPPPLRPLRLKILNAGFYVFIPLIAKLCRLLEGYAWAMFEAFFWFPNIIMITSAACRVGSSKVRPMASTPMDPRWWGRVICP